MLISLALGSIFGAFETIITACTDYWPRLRDCKPQLVIGLASLMTVLGLIFTCPGGIHMFTLFNNCAPSWNLILFAFLEVILMAWVYGIDNFLDNITEMLGGLHPIAKVPESKNSSFLFTSSVVLSSIGRPVGSTWLRLCCFSWWSSTWSILAISDTKTTSILYQYSCSVKPSLAFPSFGYPYLHVGKRKVRAMMKEMIQKCGSSNRRRYYFQQSGRWNTILKWWWFEIFRIGEGKRHTEVLHHRDIWFECVPMVITW